MRRRLGLSFGHGAGERMLNAGPWAVILDGDSRRVILGVDFPVTGRADAGFSDLAVRTGPEWSGCKFLQTALPDVPVGQAHSADAYTERWVQALYQEQWQVIAVLGYCAGSSYAAAIAEDIGRWQNDAPRLILFDPELSDAGLLIGEMRKSLNRMAPLLRADEADYAENRLSELADPGTAAIADLAGAIVHMYREIGSAVFRRLGLGQAREDEAFQLFESYMLWLSAGAQIDPNDAWKRSVAIISADHAEKADHDRSVGTAIGMIGRSIRLAVKHDNLLRSELAARTLLEQMARS